jgi:alcohol dehydrogenase class IV
VGTHAVSEKPYELACEASIRAIEAQAATVESLRSRAGTILAATALVTSFFGGQALSRAGRSPVHVVSYATGAIGLFIAASSLALAMLLPYSMRFSLSAATILKFADDEAFTPAEALREVALQYEAMHEANSRQLRLLVACFRLAIVCLIGEIGLWLTVLARGEL